MTQLGLTLFGGFEATLGSRALTFARKAQALLAFLALSRGHASSRAQLMALLWAERGEEQARNSLRQVLFDVRKALGPDGAGLLRADHERVELCAARLEVDAVAFQELAKTTSSEALARAVALYRGELLAGLAVKEAPFESWLAGERERLQQLAVRVLSARLEQHRTAGSLDAVIQTALRLLALDPLQEPGHRALMKSYAAQANRALALRQYQICVDTLRRELRVEPEAETRQLALSLAAVGRFPEAVSEAERAVADAEASEFPMFALCFTTLHLGWVFLQHGQPDRAIPPLERSHSLARMWHMGVMQPAATGALGHAYVLAGRHAALGEIWPPPMPVRHAALTMVEHGECFLALGRTEEASALAHAALENARQFGERGHEARALAFLGTVEARRAGAGGSRAGELYEEAMAMAEELAMRPLVARCHLDAGCLWLAAGHRASAREHLERAAATFRELDMSCWLAQAESALRGQAFLSDV